MGGVGSAGRRVAPVALVAASVAASGLALSAGALAQTSVPPPTPGPDGSPSPFPTVLVTPPPSAAAPDLDVPAAILVDIRTGQVLFEREPDQQRPIASLTKVMTAVVVLARVGLDDVATVSGAAASQPGSEAGLVPGEEVSVRELLFALLVSSANDAAVALAEHVSGDVATFVAEMNRRAADLGLAHTRFTSPTGLDDAGYSTAADVAHLIRFVYATPEASSGRLIARAARAMFHRVPAPDGPPRRLQNRNVLLWLYRGAIGLKTGQTPGAGFCVAAVAERAGRRLAAVVLGGEDEVFSEAAALLDHGFHGFEERVLVEAGEVLDSVASGGRTYPLVAGRGLVRLRPVGESVAVERTVRIRPGGLDGPLAPGDPVGSVVVRVGDEAVGRVPLVVGEAEPEPSPSPGAEPAGAGGAAPWWPVAVSALALASFFGLLALFRTLQRSRS